MCFFASTRRVQTLGSANAVGKPLEESCPYTLKKPSPLGLKKPPLHVFRARRIPAPLRFYVLEPPVGCSKATWYSPGFMLAVNQFWQKFTSGLNEAASAFCPTQGSSSAMTLKICTRPEMAAAFRPLDWTGFGPWQSWAQVLDSFLSCLASCSVCRGVVNRGQ